MKRLLSMGMMALGLLLLPAASPAWAQAGPAGPGINPYTRPTVSPYLNLLRRGSPQVLNYYNLVRPQVETTKSINTIQQQLSLDQAALNQLNSSFEAATVRPTGYPTRFMSHTRYFLNAGAGAGIGARPGAAPPARAP